MTARALVLDANILVGAVLGSRVPVFLADHAAEAAASTVCASTAPRLT